MIAPQWQWVVFVFLGAVGGVIGSFLNVVVYRLPAGKSIVRPGSRCPKCGHAVRWYDNLPVLSWFLLMGRCRDCGGLISWRYPAVEAVSVLLFLVLGAWELAQRGSMLPLRPIRVDSGVIFMSLTAREATAVYVYHLMLCCTLLAAALVEYDHPKAPRSVWVRLFWPAWLWGVVAPMVWPWVHPVPAFGPMKEGWLSGLLDAAAGAIGGLAAGVVVLAMGILARTLSRLRPVRSSAPKSGSPSQIGSEASSREEKGSSASEGVSSHFFSHLGTSWEAILGAAMLGGIYLGWQAGLGLTGGAGIVWTLAQVLTGRIASARQQKPGEPSPKGIPFSALLGAGALGWILFWQQGLLYWQEFLQFLTRTF